MKVFILDVDGVMTTGQFFYSEKGKLLKVFGPDDNDALSILSKYIDILFVTSDSKGFPISKKRIVDDMGYKLELVSQFDRKKWIASKYKLSEVIYMGDGIFDNYVMDSVGYSIAPSNANIIAKKSANIVTKCSGGNRAVAEACIHILNYFFKVQVPLKNFPKILNN